MKVRFTKRAAAQIGAALDYVAERSPAGSRSIRNRLQEVILLLAAQPDAGYKTDRPGVRRFVTAPYPYLIDYRTSLTEIVVLRFRHASRSTK